MRGAAIAGLALLALIAGLLLWRARPARSVRAPAASRSEEIPDRVKAQAATSGQDPRPDPAADAAWIEVRGTLLDEHRRPLSEEKGTLRVVVSSVPIDVEVARSTWRARVPPGPRLYFEDIRLGDRKAIPLTPHLEMPEDGVVEVPCRWFVPTLLRVIGEKGEDLEEVVVVEGPPYGFRPPKGVAGAKSPVVLSHDEGVRGYWVSARDHAWAHVTVALGHGGERVVRLSRAGALQVRLLDFDPEAEVTLHVNALFVDADPSGETLIEGLPRGRFELHATTWLTYATTEVEIEPLRTREVVLAAPPIPEWVPLEGTLHIDPGWRETEDSRPSVRAWAPDGIELVMELEADGRWFAGSVPPGRYVFMVEPWAWLDAVEVGPSGKRDVRLVVPPPCDVEMRLVDAETGEAIEIEDRMDWQVWSPRVSRDLARYAAWGSGAECEPPGFWRFRAPVGRLCVDLWNDLVHATEVEFDLKPGLNRIDLGATWHLSVDLALRDGAMPVPVDAKFGDGVLATPLGHDGEREFCGAGDPFRVWFTKPGRYRLTLPAVEGYEPILPLEVEVRKGVIPKVEVLLTRESR